MVQTTRKRASIAALLLAILVAAPALPLGPLNLAGQAEAQLAQAGFQLTVDQEGITIDEGHFVGNGTVTIHVPILNYGAAYTWNPNAPTTLPQIPVFAWIEPLEWKANGRFTVNNSLSAGTGVCKQIPSFAAATANPHGGPSTPDRKVISMTLDVPGATGDQAAIGYDIAILVNRAPPANDTGAAFGTSCTALRTNYGPTGATGTNGHCSSPTASAGADCDGSDNVGYAYFVRDSRWDLTITDLEFCRGDGATPTNADCRSTTPSLDRTNMTRGLTSGLTYNSTRRPNDWPCDNATLMQGDVNSLTNEERTARTDCTVNSGSNLAPPNFGDSARADAYFVALIKNQDTPFTGFSETANATWTDDRDRGNCSITIQQSRANPTDPSDLTVPNSIPDLVKARDDRQKPATGTDPCNQIPYSMSLTIKGRNIDAENETITGNVQGKGFLPWASLYATDTFPSIITGSLNLTGLMGLYDVFARIDPDNNASQSFRENDYFNTTIDIAWTDLQTLIDTSNLKTTAADAYPYPTKTHFDIPVHVEFVNTGTAAPATWLNDGTKALRPVNWSIWMDDPDPSKPGLMFSCGPNYDTECKTIGAASDAGECNAASCRISINRTFKLTSDPANDDAARTFVNPGKRVLHACIDCDPLNQTSYWSSNNRTFELDESNNVQVIDLQIKNAADPVLKLTWGHLTPLLSFNASYDSVQENSICSSGCKYTGFRPHEDVNVTMNITDLDQANLKVSFVFALKSNASVTRTYPPCPPGSGVSSTVNCVLQAEDSRYFAHITDFAFNNSNTSVKSEDWTVFANATNSGDRTTASATTAFKIVRWPLHSSAVKDLDLTYGLRNLSAETAQSSNTAIFDADNGNYSYGDNNRWSYWLHVTEDETGILDQPNVTTNLGMRIDFPHNQTRYYNGTTANYWTHQNSCPTDPGSLPGGVPDPTHGAGSGASPCSGQGNFSSPDLASIRNEPGDLTGPGLPGRWNITLYVTDKAGDTRNIARTIVWIKEPPQLKNATFSTHSVDPGESFRVHLNASDSIKVVSSYVNFSRAQPTPYNVSYQLDGVPANPQSIEYNNTIQTGRDSMFGVAGNFTAWFSAVDEFGNWNKTEPVQFLVNDSGKPILLSAGTNVARQEISLNVNFSLSAVDETNITAYLQVLRGSETIVPDVSSNTTKLVMPRISSGNYSYEANFSTEGSYVWNMWVEDSLGQRSDLRTGPLSISNNFPPRMEILEPDPTVNTIDGQLYSKAQPTLVFTLKDFEGVSKDSIVLAINDRVVVPDSIEPVTDTSSGKGWIVTYAVPSTQRFHHLDVVHVNLTAMDLSSDSLNETDTFTFVVDDVAPVAHLLDFTPRFRSEDRNIWNVSLQTQFSLVADDNDNLPTGVDRILYSIIGGGNNAATNTYANSPFTIGSAPGIYTGPRVYQIQFWAVDSVGNENRTHDSITVYVDDLPPSLDPFGSLPQGRFINASFIDDRSGVDRAVVWSSTNGAPYTPQALDFNAGVWSTQLSEGKKGDTIAYYLQAWDRVNNTDTFGNSTVPYSKYVVGNHVPDMKVTAPADGSTISHVVDLTWSASDADNDALTFTVFYRAPGKTQFVELAKVTGDARRYTLDSAKFADGQYTFRVTATDGTFVALGETTVTILNSAGVFKPGPSPPGEISPGNPILLTVQITKAQAVVEANVYRNGKLVQKYPMNDEGRDGDLVANDGTYSVRVAFDQSGDYSVDFAASYQEDGQTKQATIADQQHFTVKLTPNAIFQEYGVFLVLVGLLAVAGIGVAAFVLIRRR